MSVFTQRSGRHVLMTLCMFLVQACQATEPELSGNTVEVACHADGYTLAELEAFKANQFDVDGPLAPQSFALGFTSCLGDPNPQIRDGLAYEGLATLMRKKALEAETVQELRLDLSAKLRSEKTDEFGFEKPFAALVLAEVARVDRVSPYLSDVERQDLVNVAVEYVSGITDYRGYSDDEGWRHGVAHGGDLLMQLALNDEVTPAQQSSILEAVLSQVRADGEHSYIYGESSRLARPVLFIARQGELDSEIWDRWFVRLSDPSPLNEWREGYQSEAGLAQIHNTKAFVNAIYINALQSRNENVQALAEQSLNVLKGMP